jgi:hypothetical protein
MIVKRLIVALVFSVTQFALLCLAANAESVTIDNGSERGQGLVFREGRVCYVIMPRHVAGEGSKVTIYSGAPVLHSTAYVVRPFWSGMDLAIGTVHGAVEKRCTAKLSDLDNEAQPDTGARLQLLHLLGSGEAERIDMVVTRSEYLTLDAQFANEKNELFKGLSGSFLFDADRPVGMIIETPSATEGHFIRIEEIHQNVARYLARRAGFSSAVGAVETVSDADASIPFTFVSATLPPISPEFSEENMAASGSYVFRLTRLNRIAFKAVGADAVTLSGLRINSEPGNETAGLPRDIQVDVSSAPDGVRIRSLFTGQMAPDGTLDLAFAGTRVRWVFVTIRSGWDRPEIGIESIVFR